MKGRQAKAKGNADARPGSTPFPLPVGWVLAELGSICSKTGSGSTPRGGHTAYTKNGIPFLRSQNVHNDALRLDDVAFIDPDTHSRMSGTAVQPGDLLLNITGGSMGRCCRVPDDFEPANISQHVAIIRAAVRGMSDFLHCLALSPYFQSFIFSEQTRAGRGGLPKNRMDLIAVALPPLAEQHRIVSKVEELMALCDKLDAARSQREATRDRLAAASLARLSTPVPVNFLDDARFALGNLPSVTTRGDDIKRVRQVIINLAVAGMLGTHRATDEHACNLLKHIDSVKAGLGVRTQPRISEAKYSLPKGWAIATLAEYAIDVCTGPFGSALHQSDYVEGGIPLVNPSHMISDEIVPEHRVAVSEPMAIQLSSYRLQAGDIVMARRGEVGRAALVRDDQAGWLCGTGSFFLRFSEEVNRRYFLLLLRSSGMRSYLAGKAVGTTMVNLNHGILKAAVLLIPPLKEQSRIVAKVDELMTLCDQLESALNFADTTRRRLLDALLHEALAPAVEAAA